MSWGFVGSTVLTTVLADKSADKQAGAARDAAATQQASISEGIEETRRASAEGLEFLAPFTEIGQAGIDQAGFLTDPQAQFDFLQNNPLFQLSLDNANTRTQQSAAARGRLSAGDTLQQLSENVLLSAQPLIAQQKGSISDLINLASGTARSQANIAIGTGTGVTNLLTSSGDVGAAGIIGAANARAAGDKAIAEGIGSIASPLISKLTGKA